MGLPAWHRAERERPLWETWYDNKAKGTAEGHLWLGCSSFSTAAATPGCTPHWRDSQQKQLCISEGGSDPVLRWRYSSRPCYDCKYCRADFVRYAALAKHTALTAELLSKERGASFCFSVLLTLFKPYLSKAYGNIFWCKCALENVEVLLCWPLRVWADCGLSYPFPDVFLLCFTPTSPAEIPYCSCLGTGVTILNVVTVAE